MTKPGTGPVGEPGDDDPFERLVLNEEFVRSAEISEISAKARRRRARRAKASKRAGRWGRRARGKRPRPGGSGRPRPPGRAGDPGFGPARRPSRLPDWTHNQWIATVAFALAAVAYLYASMGGPL
ncbi:MAG: hypothetical protein ACRDY0_06810 [Acidimicrobiales bacterium]